MSEQKKRAAAGTVDLPSVIADTIDRVRKIDTHKDWDQSEKTRRHRVLAESVKNKLHEDGRKSAENKVSLATYRRYLTDVRKAITDQNWHHHGLDKKLDVLARRYPQWADQIRSVRHDLVADTRLAHKALLEQLVDHPDAYNDLKGVPIDHEIMRHLSMASAQKAKLGQQQQQALAEKKHSAIEVDRAWLLVTVKSLLTPDTDSPISFARLALGVAFATGRRAVEVLYQGKFEAAGRYELTFAGHAKKRGGADYEKTSRIYSMVDTAILMPAIELLRSQPEVLALHDKYGSLPESERNRQINHQTAANLNNTAKRVWGDENRVFRDSRAVWARFVFEEHFRKDKRWKSVDEDVFWHEQLGHEDLDTQQAYKQFKLIDIDRASTGDRLSAVRDLLRHPEVMKRGALTKITNWAIDLLQAEPDATITQHRIITEVGSGRGVIKDWLALAEKALNKPVAAPGQQEETPAEPEPEQEAPEVAAEKPRFRAYEIAPEYWQVIITIGDDEYLYEYTGTTKTAAMQQAWADHQSGS